MTLAVVEARISCPYCAESMDLVLDLTGGGQSYVEDCQICCQPMEISFAVDEDEFRDLQVGRA